jgi:hypothetical protein
VDALSIDEGRMQRKFPADAPRDRSMAGNPDQRCDSEDCHHEPFIEVELDAVKHVMRVTTKIRELRQHRTLCVKTGARVTRKTSNDRNLNIFFSLEKQIIYNLLTIAL